MKTIDVKGLSNLEYLLENICGDLPHLHLTGYCRNPTWPKAFHCFKVSFCYDFRAACYSHSQFYVLHFFSTTGCLRKSNVRENVFLVLCIPLCINIIIGSSLRGKRECQHWQIRPLWSRSRSQNISWPITGFSWWHIKGSHFFRYTKTGIRCTKIITSAPNILLNRF